MFATLNKKDVTLNAKWESLAAKELKGKDLKETLVRETNEQMLMKPLYTQEDWQPAAGATEVPGKLIYLCCHDPAYLMLYNIDESLMY